MKTLIHALAKNKNKLNIKDVLVPLPCIGVGMMDPSIMAKQIKVALQASEGNGIIHAIYMNTENENKFRKQNLNEYHPDNVAQNSKICCIQMIKL